MKNITKEDRNSDGQRPVDSLVHETRSWIGRGWVFVKKTEIRTWKGVFILAFCAGLAAAAVLLASMGRQSKSKAAGEAAELALNPAQITTTAGSVFPMNVFLDTLGNNVVVAKADIQYDKNVVQLLSYDTSDSVFAAGNACIYNGKPCEIIENDAANGKISITLAKPTPGVRTSSGKIATLSFRALQAISSSPITVSYIAAGNYTDSDVILDNGNGTDILAFAVSSLLTVIQSDAEPVIPPVVPPVVDPVIDPIPGSDPPPVLGSVEDSFIPYLVKKGLPVSLATQDALSVKSTTIKFQGKKTDLIGGTVAVYQANKLKRNVRLDGEGNWRYSVRGKANSSSTYKFVYINAQGQTVNKTPNYRIKIDTKKPIVTRPASRITASPGSTVAASASGGPIVTYNFTWSANSSMQSSAARTFVVPADTPIGTYQLSITAEDQAGNVSKARRIRVTIK